MRFEVNSPAALDRACALLDARNGDKPPCRIQRFEDIPLVHEVSSRSIEWVVDDFLAAGTVNMVAAESESGKSSIASKLGWCVSRGLPFAGMKTHHRRVLYLDRENPSSVTIERMERLKIRDSDWFRIWGLWTAQEPPSPLAPILQEIATELDPAPLFIFDSFIAFHPGAENDSTETRRYMDGFRRLANHGATVLILHHSGKSETSKVYRGSSDIKASLDSGYGLTNEGPPGLLKSLNLRAFKSRFRSLPSIKLDYADGEFLAREGGADQSEAIVLPFLREHIGITKSEFEERARDHGLGRNQARKCLAKLIRDQVVEVKASRGKGDRIFLKGESVGD